MYRYFFVIICCALCSNLGCSERAIGPTLKYDYFAVNYGAAAVHVGYRGDHLKFLILSDKTKDGITTRIRDNKLYLVFENKELDLTNADGVLYFKERINSVSQVELPLSRTAVEAWLEKFDGDLTGAVDELKALERK